MPKSIRIVRIPSGEAPNNIRFAWVGVVIPLPEDNDYPHFNIRLGIVTGKVEGPSMVYTVRAKEAVDQLEKASPIAAMWWKEHDIYSGRIAFNVEECELVEYITVE